MSPFTAARLLLARRGRLRGVAFVVLLFVVLALGAALRLSLWRGAQAMAATTACGDSADGGGGASPAPSTLRSIPTG